MTNTTSNTLLVPDSKGNEKRSAIKSDAGDTDRSKIERKPFLKLESTAKVESTGKMETTARMNVAQQMPNIT